jgi:hypothetical protein
LGACCRWGDWPEPEPPSDTLEGWPHWAIAAGEQMGRVPSPPGFPSTVLTGWRTAATGRLADPRSESDH